MRDNPTTPAPSRNFICPRWCASESHYLVSPNTGSVYHRGPEVEWTTDDITFTVQLNQIGRRPNPGVTLGIFDKYPDDECNQGVCVSLSTDQVTRLIVALQDQLGLARIDRDEPRLVPTARA